MDNKNHAYFEKYKNLSCKFNKVLFMSINKYFMIH